LPKRIEIRIAGLGGQGVVLAGQILGRAAVYDGKYAVQTGSYGAEARGSYAKSEVIISNEKIGFPLVRKCDVLVVMSQTALQKNLKDLKEDGILIIDDDINKEKLGVKAKVFRVAASRTAEAQLKSRMYANSVMLGVLTEVTGVVSQNAAERAIVDSVSKEAQEKNINAFRLGLDLMKK
jgi:2-oxoglutarate ferredoxin oxidoreductase subunit gamma